MTGIDDRATLETLNHAFDLHASGLRINRNFRRGRNVTPLLKSTSNATPASVSFLSVPTEFIRRRFQHGLQSRILDVLQTKLQRIHLEQLGQFVHVHFACKMVGSRGESTIRTLSKRRLAVVKLNVLVWKVVLDLNAGAAGVVVVKLPRGDGAVVLHAAVHFDHTRRTKVGPVKFFLARPDEFDGLASRTRKSRRFDRAFAR